MAVSTAQATAMLGALPGTLYVQPHSGDPGAAGTLNVIAGAARSAFTLPAASGGQRSIVTSVDCPNVPAGASPSHVSYWNGPVGSGSFLFSEPLGVSVTFLYAGTLRFTSQVFTVTTVDTSGSQTSTSVVADSSAVVDVATGRLLVKTTDTTSQSDVAAAFTGSGANDTSSQADSSAIRLGVVVADSTSQADTAARGGAVSDVTDTTTAVDSHTLVQTFRSPTDDTSGGSDSDTASVATGGGGPVAVSDTFTRANAYDLGANWLTITGLGSLWINANAIAPGSSTAGNAYNATPAADQYAEAYLAPGADFTAGYGHGVIVRAASAEQTFYAALFHKEDDGEGGALGPFLALWKCVAGTWTQIGSTYNASALGDGGYVLRLEAQGTTIRLLTAPTHGGTYTPRVSGPDASIATGRVGLVCPTAGYVFSMDNFYGGDL